MKCCSKEVVKVAKSWLGYEEKRSNKDLEKKHANVGHNNYTIFGKWIGANGDYWCASFVSYCFDQAYGNKGKELLCGAYSPACETIRQNFIKKKQYIENKAKVGDCVFFKGTRHAGANHIGIVIEVKDGKITTIEGNADNSDSDNGGAVVKKYYAINYPRILGFGHPKYDNIKTKANCKFYIKPNCVQGSYCSLPKGTTLNGFVKDLGNGWSKVKKTIAGNKQTGYVKNSCISGVEKLSAYPKGKVTSTCRLHKKNSKSSASICNVEANSTVTIIAKRKFWTNVKFNNLDGFIATKFIK